MGRFAISPFLAKPRRSETISRVIRIVICNSLFGIIIDLYEQNLWREQAISLTRSPFAPPWKTALPLLRVLRRQKTRLRVQTVQARLCRKTQVSPAPPQDFGLTRRRVRPSVRRSATSIFRLRQAVAMWGAWLPTFLPVFYLNNFTPTVLFTVIILMAKLGC
jgi:hypothetical protein